VSKDSNRVAVALITDDQDNVLMGQRLDSGKFTQPGGHCHVNEDTFECLVREIKEETGYDVKEAKLCKMCKRGPKLIYLYQVEIEGEQDTSNDPDNEVETWAYIDPNNVLEDLHVPLEHNILLKYWAEN
jgi:8-oxo-dGTP pyrophosphatase MutT (NUDIX family)